MKCLREKVCWASHLELAIGDMEWSRYELKLDIECQPPESGSVTSWKR